MKTRILLITLVLAIMLMLSGCDAILEAFYPEFGPDNNSIFLTVDIDSTLSGTPDLSTPGDNNYINDFSDYPIVAALVPLEEDGTFDRANIFVHEPQFSLYEFNFDMIPQGKYQIIVWYDSWDSSQSGNLPDARCRKNKPDWDLNYTDPNTDREPVVWAHKPGDEDIIEIVLDPEQPVKELTAKVGRHLDGIPNVNPDDLNDLFPY